MHLRTLGGLELTGSNFRRGALKPLLLLAHLALEGPKPRRYLAELVWPEAADPMNSLKVVLHKLRGLGAIFADDERAWTTLECDALELRDALRAGKLTEAVGLYRGAFLEGAEGDSGEELEDWIYTTRESLAREVRLALLELAEREAALGQFAASSDKAETAYRLPGAPPVEPEELPRFYPLLVAGTNPLADAIKREAQELGVELALSSEAARGRLRQSFVGRERELEKLTTLEPGGWAWVRGGAATGKTALLKRLERQGGLYIPSRQGLPYATLEPLLGNVSGGPEELLRRLAGMPGLWLIDGWSRMDAESRDLLVRLHGLRSKARVVVASRDKPPFEVAQIIELGPLSREEVEPYPGAFEATGGVPALVGAFLRGEPLEGALEGRLESISDPAREIYGALSLLETPNLAVARKSVGLGAAETAQALEELVGAGLVEPSGAVRARGVAGRWLATRPALEAYLILALAPLLPDLEAFPLYQRAKGFTDGSELPGMRKAYLAWAGELLKRGFPQRAAETLAEIDPAPEVSLLRSRALERAGQYKEALEVLSAVPENPEVLALKGALFWRLGKPEEARKAAEQALEGDMLPRAEALNTLGLINLFSGGFQESVANFRKAAALWQTLGEDGRWMDVLKNLAVARSELGEPTEEAFREVLSVAETNPVVRARVLLNLGKVYEGKTQMDEAANTYSQAAAVALESGALDTSARAWNNIGVVLHNQDRKVEAEEAYRQALAVARQAGEIRLQAVVLGNLAELTGNLEALEEAIHLLKRGGHTEVAERFQERLETIRLSENSHTSPR